ncbi:Uncharacterised protein [Sphingobacterium mizutaii]|uniref:Uncharacterized protein n=1 Tax=Sphingobacterium mizutaii TaxID=1010 RepID=A0AAJ5C220_9SPHI|nr:hypothetical protein SAMN05192578_104214 [Sphingobacterium mizutaii]SNV62171.1 Uncharacterised protein [Sphingobacterium mizutaii]
MENPIDLKEALYGKNMATFLNHFEESANDFQKKAPTLV